MSRASDMSERRMGDATRFPATPRPWSSIWGAVDHAVEVAAGMWKVSTPGHGGYLLSPERVAAMPALLLVGDDIRRGIFEEDCDWSLVALAFPEQFGELDQYYARRTVADTCTFSYPGFNDAPWKAITAAYPPIEVKDMSRAARIALLRNEYRWNNQFRELDDAEAQRMVDAGQDIKQVET